MSIRNLDTIFAPRSIAVVGASEKKGSVGFTLLENLQRGGFPGEIFPVNPGHRSIAGIAAHPSVGELPETPDLAVIATPARTVPGLVGQCGEAGIGGVIVVSAGFRELGPQGVALEEELRRELERFPGTRILGPNCLGVIVPRRGLNASFAAGNPGAGRVGFISQSGALCTSVLDWALEEGIGFSFFISVGNMLDVDFGDLIDYLAADRETESLILYVESIAGARKFISAARAFTRTKPIVAYKAGRFAESARAAASHTGALAGEDAVYEAAFERAGIVRVFESRDMFDCAELLARQRAPRRERLAIVTNAGGPGVMATDALIDREGSLAKLSERSIAELSRTLPPFWSRGNPVDVLGDAPPDRYGKAVEIVLADEDVDAVLVILTPQAMTDPAGTARAVATVARGSVKPIVSAWMGGRMVREGVEILNRAGIPTYDTPEHAVQAFLYLVRFARNREILYETPRDLPVLVSPDRRSIETILAETKQRTLPEALSKSLLAAYGIPVVAPRRARSAEEAIEAARHLGFPVVLKIDSPQITHKTDVGGVRLDLANEREVAAAFQEIVESASSQRPDARIDGVTVQSMVSSADGVEVILGMRKDPTFGAAIMVGMGGVAAELLRDRSLGLPPLNERLARRMIESLRSWPLLQGYRGRPPVRVDLLLEILIRFSYLVADLPQIQELDVNPLLVTPRDVVALDARVILDPALEGRTVKPYEHLVIRPYPEQYVQRATLADGTPLTLRPIRPEDEPLWHDLLAESSPDTLFQRFQHSFKRTHEVATRYCFIDYDREIAIVAEVEAGKARKLAGVGRLVADPDHESAEYAVMVSDAWQGKGLGGLLTDYCLAIAQDWGIARVTAVTTPDNFRMIEIFRNRGFEVEQNVRDHAVMVSKRL